MNLNRLTDSLAVQILMDHDYPDKAVQRRCVKLADVCVFLDRLNPSYAVDLFLLTLSQPFGIQSDTVLQRRLFSLLLLKSRPITLSSSRIRSLSLEMLRSMTSRSETAPLSECI